MQNRLKYSVNETIDSERYDYKQTTWKHVKNTSSNGGASKVDKKLSCRREALRCIMLFCFITRGQSRSFEMASL